MTVRGGRPDNDGAGHEKAGGWPRLTMLGYGGLVVTFADGFSDAANRAALTFRAALVQENWPQVAETATSLVSVLVRTDGVLPDAADLVARVQALLDSRDWLAQGPCSVPAAPPRRLTIPACFDPELAPQIDEAAAAAGLTRSQAVASLTGADLRVLTIGFAPGQPYIGQLPSLWDLPRQRTLTPRVPVGALGLAIRQMVLFAVETQTGWRHVGQTALRLFQPDAPDPFVLRPGDRLRLRAVPADQLAALRQDPLGGVRIETVPQ